MKKQEENSHEGIKWSEMGKQNVQAEKVYYGICYASVTEDHQKVYAKAECLVHFSYTFSEKKMMLVDLQGSMFKLYDPEIATSKFTSDTDKLYFCAGNLSYVRNDNFSKAHECNKYCELMGLKD